MTSNLESVRRKVESGERFTAAEGEAWFDPRVDLHALGELADAVRRRKHSDAAYYNVNAHLNPTNICTYRCPLCAYSRDPDDPTAYAMTRDEILQRGGEAAASLTGTWASFPACTRPIPGCT
jgi:aminodeoxyfutalosine synthase